MAKKGLGRGLGALLPSVDFDEKDESGGGIKEVKLTEVEPNKEQPRKDFDPESLESLAESIRQHGVLQPLIVRKLPNGFYQIIAGERRWRAARIAGLKSVPIIEKELNKQQVLEVALIENLQREDLNIMEEAEGYRHLIEEYNLTQEEVSKAIGKSRSAIANALRLLNLPNEVLQLLRENKLSSGHARTVLSIEDKNLQIEAANKIVDEQLSVREAEKLVKGMTIEKQKSKSEDNMVQHQVTEVESDLSGHLNTKVKIVPGKSKGKIEIEYYGYDDLERIKSIIKNQ